MPMKCMAQTPAPSARLPVNRNRVRWRVCWRAWPAICKPIQEAKIATSKDSRTSFGS